MTDFITFLCNFILQCCMYDCCLDIDYTDKPSDDGPPPQYANLDSGE